MRKTLVHGFAAAAAALALIAAPAGAQGGITFGVGGGAAIPLADFADEDIGGAEIGYQGMAFVGYHGMSVPVGFRVDGMFQRHSMNDDAIGEGDFDVNYQLISGTANVVYEFATSEETRFRPYLIGGGGIYNVDLKGDDADDLGFEDETKFGLNGGAGFNFALGNLGLFIEGRFHNVFTDETDVNFIPITLGLRFGGQAPE